MVKTQLLRTWILGLLIVAAATSVNGQCTDRGMKEIKPLMQGYTFDALKPTNVKKGGEEGIKEIGMILLKNMEYRFVFDMADAPEGTVVTIYDLELGKEDRKQLWSSEGIAPDAEGIIAVVPTGYSRRVYINYEVPEANSKRGCIMFLLGYKDK